MTFSVEQGSMLPGSPEGSEEHEAFLEGAYDSDPVAEEIQAPADEIVDETQGEEEEVTEDKVSEDEEIEEPEEPEGEVDPLIQAKLDELDKLKVDLEDQKRGLDKYFTEQSEEFKRLREEAGVEETHKTNKAAKKELKGYGFKDDGEYIPKNFTDSTGDEPGMLSDKIIDFAVKNGTITQNEAGMAKGSRKIINAVLNQFRSEILGTIRDEIAGVNESLQPMRQEKANDAEDLERRLIWRASAKDFAGKYKPTEVQKKALGAEIDSNMELIDTMTPKQTETWMRRVIHDPEVLKKSAVEPKKRKAKKPAEEPETSEPKREKNSSEELLSSMFDH